MYLPSAVLISGVADLTEALLRQWVRFENAIGGEPLVLNNGLRLFCLRYFLDGATTPVIGLIWWWCAYVRNRNQPSIG